MSAEVTTLTAAEQAELEKLKAEVSEVEALTPVASTDLRLPIVPVLPLLNEHSALIEALRAACQAELNSDPDPVMTNHYNDNVFLLRFLMSAKYDLTKATTAVRTAIAWRNKHREALAKIRAGQPVPGLDRFKQFAVNDFHGTTVFGGPLVVMRTGLSDTAAMQENIDDETLQLCVMLSREVPYIQCDAETRKRGQFVKVVSIMDMAHMQLSRAMDRKWMAKMGSIAKTMELVYPQLLGASIVVNPPTWFRVVWAMASPFMPQSTKEKMVVCGHKHATWKAHKSDARKCPFASHFTDPAALPTFLGGQCKCRVDPVNFPEGRCICGIDNRRQINVTDKPLPLR